MFVSTVKERNDVTANKGNRPPKERTMPFANSLESYLLDQKEKKTSIFRRCGNRKSPAEPSHEAHEWPVGRPKQRPVSRPVYGRAVHASDVRAMFVEPRRKPAHGCRRGARPKEICSGWTQSFIGADGLVEVLGHLATVHPSVSYVRRMCMAETGGR